MCFFQCRTAIRHTQHPLLVGRGTTCAFITGHRLLIGCCCLLDCLQLSFNFFSFTMISWFDIFVFICIPAFLIFDISSKPFPAFGQKISEADCGIRLMSTVTCEPKSSSQIGNGYSLKIEKASNIPSHTGAVILLAQVQS